MSDSARVRSDRRATESETPIQRETFDGEGETNTSIGPRSCNRSRLKPSCSGISSARCSVDRTPYAFFTVTFRRLEDIQHITRAGRGRVSLGGDKRARLLPSSNQTASRPSDHWMLPGIDATIIRMLDAHWSYEKQGGRINRSHSKHQMLSSELKPVMRCLREYIRKRFRINCSTYTQSTSRVLLKQL